MAALDKSFTATLQKSPNKGGWTFVVWPDSVDFFGTRGLVKPISMRPNQPHSNLTRQIGIVGIGPFSAVHSPGRGSRHYIDLVVIDH